MDILQVDQISFSYNGLTVLSDVRFGVEKGDFLGLIGPNGSGKTTLLKLIDGLLQPIGDRSASMARRSGK